MTRFAPMIDGIRYVSVYARRLDRRDGRLRRVTSIPYGTLADAEDGVTVWEDVYPSTVTVEYVVTIETWPGSYTGEVEHHAR